jgi:hypothetical protein
MAAATAAASADKAAALSKEKKNDYTPPMIA